MKKFDVSKLYSKERTVLSKERTMLSNERTLLSYTRTALASFVLGVVMLRVLNDSTIDRYIGMIAIIVGFLFLIIGSIKYQKRKLMIKKAL